MSSQANSDRRAFLRKGGALLCVSAVGVAVPRLSVKDEGAKDTEQVSPSEDLMREHGILKRVLLVYQEGVERLDLNKDLPPEPIAGGARIVRDFIEDYHEKLEEGYLFPRFKRAGKLVDLVDVHLDQHKAGRQLTDRILELATAQHLKNADDRRSLANSIRQFIRMYNPHEAREDTVLFPAFRTIVSPNEYDSLGEEFEDREHELFGDDGFERYVEKVAGLEKTLGIYDLSQFTPKIK